MLGVTSKPLPCRHKQDTSPQGEDLSRGAHLRGGHATITQEVVPPRPLAGVRGVSLARGAWTEMGVMPRKVTQRGAAPINRLNNNRQHSGAKKSSNVSNPPWAELTILRGVEFQQRCRQGWPGEAAGDHP